MISKSGKFERCVRRHLQLYDINKSFCIPANTKLLVMEYRLITVCTIIILEYGLSNTPQVSAQERHLLVVISYDCNQGTGIPHS